MLEETLRQLHEAHIAATTWPVKKNVFKDLCQTHAPLSTFAGMIKIAFAYGLISPEDYDDLELVRHLRNEAAHTIYDFSFEDHGVKDLVTRLKADGRTRQKTIDAKAFPTERPKVNCPEITTIKRNFLLNTMALHDVVVGKLQSALEALLVKRRAAPHNGRVDNSV